jgi:hypothetical protein
MEEKEKENLLKEAIIILGNVQQTSLCEVRLITSRIRAQLATTGLYQKFLQTLIKNYDEHWRNLFMKSDHLECFEVFLVSDEAVDVLWLDKLRALTTILDDQNLTHDSIRWICQWLERLLWDVNYTGLIGSAIKRYSWQAKTTADERWLLEWKEWLQALYILPEKIANAMQRDMIEVWTPM